MARRPRRAHRIYGDLRCAGRRKRRRREGWRISGTLSRTSDRSPKSLVRERMSRSRLQVDLERFRLRARREGDVGYEAPRRELGGVWRLTGVVISEPGFQVGCHAGRNVGTARLRWSGGKHSANVALLRQGFGGHPASPPSTRPILRSPKGEAGWCPRSDSNQHDLAANRF